MTIREQELEEQLEAAMVFVDRFAIRPDTQSGMNMCSNCFSTTEFGEKFHSVDKCKLLKFYHDIDRPFPHR